MRFQTSIVLTLSLAPNLSCRTQHLTIDQTEPETSSTSLHEPTPDTTSIDSPGSTSSSTTASTGSGTTQSVEATGATTSTTDDTSEVTGSSTDPNDPSTSSSTGSSSTGEPECGNGKIEGEEQCDGTDDCDDCSDCECKFFCGNGKIEKDRGETCDSLNNPNCDPITCTFCGDGIINGQQPPEQCDQGEMNGTPIPLTELTECTDQCKTGALRAFITSSTHSGKMGGISGGNTICKLLADQAGLNNPERFIAWLSGKDGYSAFNTLNRGCALPYFGIDKTKLADNAAALLAPPWYSNLFVGLVDEKWIFHFEHSVWSCIDSSGADGCSAATPPRCINWTSEDDKYSASVGLSGIPVGNCNNGTLLPWTDCGNLRCDKQAHLYCFEKCP